MSPPTTKLLAGFLALSMSVSLIEYPAEGQRAGVDVGPTPFGFMPDLEYGDEAVRLMHAFTTCLSVYRRNTARLFAAEPGSARAGRMGRAIIRPSCVRPGALRFNHILLRGGLYEAAYEREFRNAPPASFDRLPRLDYPWSGAGVPNEVRARNLAAFRFSECVVRSSPAQARALLETEVTSPEERRVFQSMAGSLSACLSDRLTVRFTRPVLRGLVAEALYRLSAAASLRPADGSARR
ncbi:hypothetical protein [Allosphingosinicella sp.]|jgi:hypothetical protein|uniref:hypothetical protein n=1 Tax=Allosphingosinicella sp. TaxID=2823234 RepID=UPI002EE31FEF